MSFEEQIAPAVGTPEADAASDAARWRGQCVDCYAQIEFLVGTALREIWAVGHKSPSQPLFTYRTKIASLRDAVGEDGFFHYKGLFRTLDELYGACDRRNLIVHSTGAVSQTPAGEWVWTGCYIPPDKDADIVAEAITRSGADQLERRLRRTIQRLTAQLSHMRKKAVTK
ncbi:hypothetical protein [Sphingomonas daechungensis]|uniref:hypothetical protein n=1 Tax=Sphingomonas daechungensis TaxID=1176646 RepID=UPI0037844CCF